MKLRKPAFTNWVCKHQCGSVYVSEIPIQAHAHFCSKKNNQHVDSIPDKLAPGACDLLRKRVASSPGNQAPTSREETDMARATPTPKAPKAPAAPKSPKAAKAEVADGEKQGRRSFGSRGWLAVEIDKFLRKQKGDDAIPVGSIVKAITNSAGEQPSTGAVAACVTRWAEQGYVKVTKTRPLSFNGFMAKWKDSSLDDFLAAEKDKRAKARAAAKG